MCRDSLPRIACKVNVDNMGEKGQAKGARFLLVHLKVAQSRESIKKARDVLFLVR